MDVCFEKNLSTRRLLHFHVIIFALDNIFPSLRGKMHSSHFFKKTKNKILTSVCQAENKLPSSVTDSK